MRLHRLSLRDYKGVAHRDLLFPEAGILVVEGPNEVGKTTMLDALDLLLEHKDTSRRAQIRAAQPVGRDVGPSVEVELSAGPYRFVYRKRWLRQTLTELTISEPTRAHLVGDEAHERVRGILAQTTDLALWKALRLLQAQPLVQEGLGGSIALATALDRAGGVAADAGAAGETLLAAAEATYLRYFTARTGAPTGEFRAAIERLEAARAAVDAAGEAVREVANDVESHESAQAALPRTRQALKEAQERQRVQEEELAAVRGATETLLAARGRRDELVVALGREQERHGERVAAGEQLAAREAALATAQDGLTATQGRLRPTQAELVEAVSAHDAAEQLAAAARARLEHVSAARSRARDRADLRALSRRLGAIDEASAQLLRVQAELARHPVDSALMRELEEAHRAAELAAAAHAAGSAAVLVRALGGSRTLRIRDDTAVSDTAVSDTAVSDTAVSDTADPGAADPGAAASGAIASDAVSDPTASSDVEVHRDEPAPPAQGCHRPGTTGTAPQLGDLESGPAGRQLLVPLPEGETWRSPIGGRLTVELDGLLEVELEPGAGAAGRAAQVREARERLAAVLTQARCSSLAQARVALDERHELQAEAAGLQARVRALLDGSTRDELAARVEAIALSAGDEPNEAVAPATADASGEAAPSRTARVAAAGFATEPTFRAVSERGDGTVCERGDGIVCERGDGAVPDVDQDHDATDADGLAAAREAEEFARIRVDTLRLTRERLTAEVEAIRRESTRAEGIADAIRDQVRDLQERLATARERWPDDALAEAVTLAHARVAQAQQVVTDAEQLLGGRDVDALTAMRDAADAEVAVQAASLRELDDQLIRLQARLDQAGGQGRAEAYDEARTELDRAERVHERLRRHAEAARLLRDTLTSRNRQAKQAYVRPFAEAVDRLGRIVYGPTFEVEVEEDLTISARIVDGKRIPFAALSTGAKEQLAILTRLACAALVDGAHGVPVVIDDALGYSDPEKLRRVCAAVGRLHDQAQVVLLTCTPGRYAAIPQAHVVRL